MKPRSTDRDWSHVDLAEAVLEERILPEEAALLIARDAAPGLCIGGQLEVLEHMAAPLQTLSSELPPAAQAAALAAYLHEDLGFRGNESAYYDPRNSYLHEVLRRRIGIPITLSLIYAAIGRRAGLVVEGIGFPGHFLIRVGGEEGVLADPFHGGRTLSTGALAALAARALGDPGQLQAAHLAPVTLRGLTVRMLMNLKRAHEGIGDRARAMVVTDRLYDLTGAAFFRRDRGLHALALGAWQQGRDDLEQYLAEVGDEAPEAPALRAKLAGLDARTERPS